jgi:hypothetical protein
LEEAFRDDLVDAIEDTCKRHGYYWGGGSNVEISSGKRHVTMSFVATPKRVKIPKEAILRAYRARRKKWAESYAAKVAKMSLRKKYEWDGQTLEAGKIYEMSDDGYTRTEKVKIIGFKKDTFGDINIWFSQLDERYHPVTSGVMHGTRMDGKGTWSRKFKLIDRSQTKKR